MTPTPATTTTTRPTILVVDDDDSIRDMLEMTLYDEGYAVRTAVNGAAALEIVRGGVSLALILLDMRMPVMDGWEFARRYRDATPRPAPIVAVTAAQDAQRWAAEIGAVGYLAKPFTLDDLFDVARTHARPPA